MSTFRKCLAEFIGTFVLVVFGCGTACAVGCSSSNGTGYLLTALAFGLVIVAMAYSIGNVSGCHINPAVSIGLLCSGKMTLKDFIAYICSQFIGAIAGGAVLLAIFGKESGLGSNGLYHDNVWASILIEVILTFVFVLTIIGVTSKKEFGSIAGVVIGLTLTLVHIFGIYFTGTSVNPARSFGPAIFAGEDYFKNVWVFIVAPLVGGVLAALVYKGLSLGICKEPEKAESDDEAPSAPAAKPAARKPQNRKKRR